LAKPVRFRTIGPRISLSQEIVVPRPCRTRRSALAVLALLGAAGPIALRAQTAPGAEPLARLELAVPGVTMEVLSLARLPGHPVLELRFNLVNGAQRPVELAQLDLIAGASGQIGNLQLLDLPNATGYVIGQAGGRNLSSLLPQPTNIIRPGERRDNLWAWFGAPPAGVTRLTLRVPGAAPALDLPIQAR
jgi:hypothetical protein